MLRSILRGNIRFALLLAALALVLAAGLAAYARQYSAGLAVTGLGREVTWGLYIAQFTFLVGVAASAVMVVIPYYLHDVRAFGRMLILGESLAVAAVTMSMLFVFVDLGQPRRVLNVLLYPCPNSLMFWDVLALGGYLLLNLVLGAFSLESERQGAPPPGWLKACVFLSIPWAVSIHTVTAFLYSGLAARPFWLTPILAPRFLASAFASGPALLILLGLILRRFARYDPGREAIARLATIVTYALLVNLFFVLVEVFTAVYSGVPEHRHALEYLFLGLDGHGPLVLWMWASVLLSVGSVVVLLLPGVRRSDGWLAAVCVAVIAAVWIEKGLGMVVAGFVPTPLGRVPDYAPTATEILITLGVYALGLLVLAVLCRIVLEVRAREARG